MWQKWITIGMVGPPILKVASFILSSYNVIMERYQSSWSKIKPIYLINSKAWNFLLHVLAKINMSRVYKIIQSIRYLRAHIKYIK